MDVPRIGLDEEEERSGWGERDGAEGEVPVIGDGAGGDVRAEGEGVEGVG